MPSGNISRQYCSVYVYTRTAHTCSVRYPCFGSNRVYKKDDVAGVTDMENLACSIWPATIFSSAQNLPQNFQEKKLNTHLEQFSVGESVLKIGFVKKIGGGGQD